METPDSAVKRAEPIELGPARIVGGLHPLERLMDTEADRVIVTPGATAHTTRVHHRDFPEIQADGQSAKEAATFLASKLTLALDTALTNWRRQTLSSAIADVEAFVQREG